MIHSFKGKYLRRETLHSLCYMFYRTKKKQSHCGVLLQVRQVFKLEFFGNDAITSVSPTCVEMKEFRVHE